MGIVRNLIGGAKPKAAAIAAPAKDTVDSVAVQEEEERRKRLLALNQNGGAAGQMTAAGGVQGEATVGRKMLLGL